MKILINKIIVGERLRQDMGDINGLAQSMKEHGLLHPIVIDSKFYLVAGGRRLEAAKQIGLLEIEVKMLGDLSERELRVLELEENIKRKDLTEIERSRNLIELVGVAQEEAIAKTELITESVNNSAGRPKSVTAIPKIAERIGVPQSTIYDAQKHVAAVDKHPALEPLSKYKAIETAKELEQIPDETARVEHIRQTFKKIDKEVDAKYKVADKVRSIIEKGFWKEITEEELDIYLELEKKPINEHIERLDITIATFQKIRKMLIERTKIRRVK